jgi:Domain of unknown function (DUF4262)
MDTSDQNVTDMACDPASRFFVMGVVGDLGECTYAYTVGQAPDMPELIIFGWSANESHRIFDQIVEMHMNEKVIFSSREEYRCILQGVSCYFHQVDRDKYLEHVGLAVRWHDNTREFPLYQVGCLDKAGLFAWQDGYKTMADQPQLLPGKPFYL